MRFKPASGAIIYDRKLSKNQLYTFVLGDIFHRKNDIKGERLLDDYKIVVDI